MRYANAKCVRKLDREAETYTYTGPCFMCKKTIEVAVPVEGVQAYCDGAHAQDAFPKLPVGDREFLISGTCSPCFDSLFTGD